MVGSDDPAFFKTGQLKGLFFGGPNLRLNRRVSVYTLVLQIPFQEVFRP